MKDENEVDQEPEDTFRALNEVDKILNWTYVPLICGAFLGAVGWFWILIRNTFLR